jgi:hypothetical protein
LQRARHVAACEHLLWPSFGQHAPMHTYVISRIPKPAASHALAVLTEYVDCIDSLWGVPDVIKARLVVAI